MDTPALRALLRGVFGVDPQEQLAHHPGLVFDQDRESQNGLVQPQEKGRETFAPQSSHSLRSQGNKVAGQLVASAAGVRSKPATREVTSEVAVVRDALVNAEALSSGARHTPELSSANGRLPPLPTSAGSIKRHPPLCTE